MTKVGEWKGGKLTIASRAKLAQLQEDPEKFNQWWGDVLDRVASGITIYRIADEEGLTQGVMTRWVKEDKTRLDAYHAAQAAYADSLIAETIAIADGVAPVKVKKIENGMVVLDDNGNPIEELVYPDAANNKNRIHVRQHAASKYDRERFGEKLDVNVAHTVDVRLAINEARNRVAERDITPEAELAK